MQGCLLSDLGLKDSLASHTVGGTLTMLLIPFPSTETYKKGLLFCFMALNSLVRTQAVLDVVLWHWG